MKKSIIFLILSLFVSAAVYRDAMWGGSLLAPLDIGPDLFSQYRFVDPKADGVPENHHIIDQFTYDLPLQHTIYKSYRNGEIPWWDPHTYGGRPLLADAHINGTDPIRLLCYALLPFELAYNWNYILRGLLTGLGMYLLLSYLGIKPLVATICALSYQFAGWFTLFFGHPWIQGSFVWYPYLWLAWISIDRRNVAKRCAIGGILCSFIFYAGNLQSHTYLPIFAATFLLSTIIVRKANIVPALTTCAMSGLVGALLAFPVLANQVEFFLLSVRPTTSSGPLLSILFDRLMRAPVALAGFYPWAFGSFKTFDASRIIGGGGVAYTLFFGTISFFFALNSLLWLRRNKGLHGCIVWQSIILVIVYLLIIASPLEAILYSRCAALAGMALTVLAGLGVQALINGTIKAPKRLTLSFTLLVVLIALGTSILAWTVFPHFKPIIEKKIVNASSENQSSYSSFSDLTHMRQTQLDRFPSEVSLANPQAALGLASAIILGFALVGNFQNRKREILIYSAMCLSLFSVIIFHNRFRPKHPIDLWNALISGGPAQKMAIEQTKGGLRLDETQTPLSHMIFPNSMASLYKVHAVYGYSALQPPSLLNYPTKAPLLSNSWKADFKYDHSSDIKLQPSDSSPSRFRLLEDGKAANVSILSETQNSIAIDASNIDVKQTIIRTDTYYPGWLITRDYTISKYEPFFSIIESNNNQKFVEKDIIQLSYEPSLKPYFLPSMLSGLFLIIVLTVSHSFLIKKHDRLTTS